MINWNTMGIFYGHDIYNGYYFNPTYNLTKYIFGWGETLLVSLPTPTITPQLRHYMLTFEIIHYIHRRSKFKVIRFYTRIDKNAFLITYIIYNRYKLKFFDKDQLIQMQRTAGNCKHQI